MINKQKIKSAVLDILEALGENPNREGLKKTPNRVANMCEEIFGGLNKIPDNIITTFKDDTYRNNTVIEIENIPVNSICEHHLLPFVGTATIKYIPKNGAILGLSKFLRIVNYFSSKPQMQERLTSEIAEFLFSKLEPKGVKVTLECEHLCMTMRGVKSRGAVTKTEVTIGDI